MISSSHTLQQTKKQTKKVTIAAKISLKRKLKRVGFEPTREIPVDLQSTAFDHSATFSYKIFKLIVLGFSKTFKSTVKLLGGSIG